MRSWLKLALLLAVAATLSAAPAAAGLRDVLPDSGAIPNWLWREPPRTYTPDDLYEYIDGSADLFLSYGFRQAFVGDYVRRGAEAHWITVDIYDMGSPLHAFGIYGAERPPDVETLPIGAQGYSCDGLTAFWKGPYYIKISLIEGDDASAARTFAHATARRIGGRAELPPELQRLPAGNRIPRSERYVKKGALGHKFLVEVVTADYDLGDRVATLHIADFSTPQKAAEGWQKLRDFESRAGEEVADVHGVGEECFAARDSYYGELLAAWRARFLVVAVSEKANRADLCALANTALHLPQSQAP